MLSVVAPTQKVYKFHILVGSAKSNGREPKTISWAVLKMCMKLMYVDARPHL